MKRRSIILGLGGLLVLALVTAASLVVWVLRTEAGAVWVTNQIQSRVPVELEIGGISGSLAEGVNASAVRLNTTTAEISIDRLTLVLSLEDLLARNIVVELLDVGAVTYRQREQTAAPASGSSLASGFTMPFAIELRQASIESLQVTTPDAEFAFGPTAFAIEASGTSIRIASFSTSTSGVALTFDGAVDTSDGIDGSGNFSWSTEVDGDSWSGNGSISGSSSALAVTHRLESPFELAAQGDVTFADVPNAAVTLEWTDFSWPGLAYLEGSSGSFALDGWLDSFDFSGSGRLFYEDEPIEFASAGAYTPEFVSFDEVMLETGFGDGRFSGGVSPAELRWDFEFSVARVDPEVLLPDWPGDVSATGHTIGSLQPELNWSVDDLSLAGTIRDEAISASGGIASSEPGDFDLERVAIEWAGNRASLAGSVSDDMDLTVDVSITDIADFIPGVGGSFSLAGDVGGSFAEPSFDGMAVGETLTAEGFSLDRFQIDGRVDVLADAEVDISFDAEGLRRDRVIADSIIGRIAGSTSSHSIAIDIAPDINAGSIRGSGGWSGEEWTGEIASIVLHQELVGTWSLDAPAALTVSRDALVFDRSCVTNNAALLCVGADLGPDTQNLGVSLESFDISALQPLIGEQVTVAGLYDAELEIQGPFNRPRGTLDLRGRSSTISISDVEAPLETRLEDVQLNAVLTESLLEASASVSTPFEGNLSVDAAVTEIWTAEPMIDATINGQTSDVAFLSILSPDVGDVSGDASLTVELTGPVRAPTVRGDIRWTNGEIEVPRWGLTVQDVDVTINSPAGNLLVYSLSGTAGDGHIELTGTTELDADRAWPTTFKISGENFAAFQLPEAQILVSPDLEVVTDWPSILVTGVVGIPSANLSLDELPAQGVTSSSDVVVHGVDAVEPQRPLDVRADLTVELGDDVRFRGSGLDAALSGGIAIEYRSGEPTIATGTVALAGTYAALGQTLELDAGRLLFTGSVIDPALDVRGIRRFETTSGEVLVGVLVTGTVSQPVTQLYSEPSMSDGDIVSYLVIGRPLSDSSQENSEALQTAALSLGLTQTLPQIQHFGEAIGLDELGIRTSDASTGELMAGKQISPRVYMRYTYGLINRIGGILLRFELSERLRLETRTGDSKTMDLLYTIERD